RRLRRLVEQLDAADVLQRLVNAPARVERLEVHAEREAAETGRGRTEIGLVVPRGVEADHDPVRALEGAMALVALRGFGPAELPEEPRHPLDVAAGEGDEADSRGKPHDLPELQRSAAS